jgi:tetratricopeptide (TPR) repeat protein
MLYRWLIGFLTLALLFTTGCAAKQAYKRGTSWEAQGEMYRAGVEYINSLNRKPDYAESVAGLKRVAYAGYEEQLMVSQVGQDNGDFPLALSNYRLLKTYIGGVKRHGALTFDVIDVDAFIENMAIAAATERYNKGKTAMAARKFQAAVGHFEAALRFKPGFRDSRAMLGKTFYSWAETLIQENQYALAAEKFLKADAQGDNGYRDARRRAAAVHLAVGRYYLDRDFCQAAWKVLKKAMDVYSTPVIGQDIQRAWDCAVRDVAVATFDDASNQQFGFRVGTELPNQLTLQLKDAAISEKYAQVERVDMSTDTLMRRGLARFERALVGNIGGISVIRNAPTTAHRQAPGKMWDRCPEGGGLCQIDVAVKYTEHTVSARMSMGGTMRLLNNRNQRSLWKRDFNKTLTAQTAYADKFMVGDIAVNVGNKKALGVVVLDKELRSLSNGPRKPSLSELARRCIAEIVSEDASAIIRVAASESKPPAPARLAIPHL